MVAVNWAFGVGGNWKDGKNWSGGVAPSAADDVTIAAVGAYTVSVTTADVATSLTFDSAAAKLVETTAGSLKISGAVNLMAGTMVLESANSFGSFAQSGGVLQLAKGSALGAADLSLSGGEVTALANETIANYLQMGGAGFIIDAAAGTTATFGSGQWSLDDSSAPAIQFGSATRTGTVVWRTPNAVIGGATPYTVDVAGGTLKAGDANFYFLLSLAASTTVATGATMDLAGFSATVGDLLGGGQVVNTGAGAALVLKDANFSGAISGKTAVEIAGTAIFTGANTYSRGTSIDSGEVLFLEGAGSITGGVVDNGELFDYDTSGTFTPGSISGTGMVVLDNTSTLVLNSANSFSGGSTIAVGKAVIGNGAALGSGAATIANAGLIATNTMTLANSVTLEGTVTLAAATGKVLTLTGPMDFSGAGEDLTVTFGDSADKGTVAFDETSKATNTAHPIHLKVAYGTLKDVNGALAVFTGAATDLHISAGANLDLDGFSLVGPSLASGGTITNSSATAATLYTTGTSSAWGVISGKTAVYVLSGMLTLTGKDTYTGGTTIGGGATLQLGSASINGSIVGAIDDEGILKIPDSGPLTISGVISGAGSLIQLGKGATILSGANTYSGGTTIEHGKLIVTNAKALGTGDVTISNAELLATNTMSLAATQNPSNHFNFGGVVTIAAAHGKTLSTGGANDVMAAGTTLIFGEGSNDGVVVFGIAAGSVPGPLVIKVNAGTLKASTTIFADLTEIATSLSVAAGATLDQGGFLDEARLVGAGKIVNSGKASQFHDLGGTFSGAITGKLSLIVGGAVTLSGANTFTGGTSISMGDTLQLGAGGATGSVVGKIKNDGALKINEIGKVTLSGNISGAGTLTQAGSGATTLSGANSYTGGTTIQRGELISTNSHGLGTGALTMTGGELLASVSQNQIHDLTTGGNSTLAAAHGQTLSFTAGAYAINAGRLYFGGGSNDGTIVFKVSGTITATDLPHTFYEVRAGTLKAGDGALSNILQAIAGTRLDAGATLDGAGHTLAIDALTGSGVLTNSGLTSNLVLIGATNFSGTIAGKISEIDIYDTATLNGNETFTGKAVIEGGVVTLAGAFGEAVQFNTGTLVLTHPSKFTGAITNFTSGDNIDLRDVTTGAGASVKYSATKGILTVSDGTHTDNLNVGKGYVVGNFGVSSDGAGGTDIAWQVAPAMEAASVQKLASAMAGFSAAGATSSQIIAAESRKPTLLAAGH